MKRLSRWRNWWAGVAWALACTGGMAAEFRVSQTALRVPELAVFLAEEAVPAGTARPPAPAASAVGVKLGDSALQVKSLQPWNAADGVALVVALDVSASLRQTDFRRIKQVLLQALEQLPPRSQVALMAVGLQPRVLQPFRPVPALDAGALESLAPDDAQTALYEALLMAQDMAARGGAELPLRRAVLVLTDALDDSRKGIGREEVLDKIGRGDAPVYALGLVLGQGRVPPAQKEALQSLARIARASGGAFVQAGTDDSASGLRSLLQQSLRVQLLLAECGRCLRDGGYHPLQVSVQRGGPPAIEVREVALRVEPLPPPPPPRPWLKIVLVLSVAGAATGGTVVVVLKRRRKPVPPPLDIDSRTTTTIAASKPVPAAGLAVTLDVAGQGRQRLNVQGEVVLGRATSADVAVPDDAEASSRHAGLYLDKGRLMLRDLGSTNGTCLNGTPIVRAEPVNDRDLITVGRTEVRVYLEEA